MNNKFDELAKGLAQSVTRRQALKQFGAGLTGMALACFGLPNRARATTINGFCVGTSTSFYGKKELVLTGACAGGDPTTVGCIEVDSSQCPAGKNVGNLKLSPCGVLVSSQKCSFAWV